MELGLDSAKINEDICMIKLEIVQHGGSVKGLVPSVVEERLLKKVSPK